MNKAKPIIFSGKMIEAILKGEKTQTRRVIKPQPYHSTLCGSHWYWSGTNQWNGVRIGQPTVEKLVDTLLEQDVCLAWPHPRCPYGVLGDKLWVRETFVEIIHGEKALYRADCDDYEASAIEWTPSIFMPKWASRIILEIVKVGVEQLQSISPADCVSEGIEQNVCLVVYPPTPKHTREAAELIARDRFRELWNSINTKRGYPWESNPWVWVIEFKVVEQ